MNRESIMQKLPPDHSDWRLRFVRMIARTLGTLLFAFIVFFAAAHLIGAIRGVEEIQPSGDATGRPTASDIPGFVALAVMTLGLAVSWFREGIGVVMIVLGLALFTISVQPVTLILVSFGSIALLFAVSWYGGRSNHRSLP